MDWGPGPADRWPAAPGSACTCAHLSVLSGREAQGSIVAWWTLREGGRRGREEGKVCGSVPHQEGPTEVRRTRSQGPRGQAQMDYPTPTTETGHCRRREMTLGSVNGLTPFLTDSVKSKVGCWKS